MVPLLVEGRAENPTVAFAHGAGAPMDHPWMTTMAGHLVDAGFRVVRFEFPYMHKRRGPEGKRPGPDKTEVLLDTWREVVKELGGGAHLAIGGKSMGGRMASMVADELSVRSLFCLGYPFHPPGQPTRLRTEHLATLRTPTLILQGTRDPMGNRDEVAGYTLSPTLRVHWVEDGDHSLKPRKKITGRSEAEALADAAGILAAFLHELR